VTYVTKQLGFELSAWPVNKMADVNKKIEKEKKKRKFSFKEV